MKWKYRSVGPTFPVYDESVRGLLVLSLLAGCGFHIAGGQQPPLDADGDALPDAEAQSDGLIDGLVDASDGPTTVSDAPCADDDADGVCNSMDTWPCGAQPTPPGSPITLDEVNGSNHMTISLSNTALTGGQRLYSVAPGATFTVTANYSIIDCICTGCIDQIQIGLIPGTAKECLYNGNPSSPCTTATTGTGMRTLTAPMTTGVYQVRFRLGQDLDCDGENNDHDGWWTNVPPNAAQTVALVCVH